MFLGIRFEQQRAFAASHLRSWDQIETILLINYPQRSSLAPGCENQNRKIADLLFYSSLVEPAMRDNVGQLCCIVQRMDQEHRV